jgi:hypothetical protein
VHGELSRAGARVSAFTRPVSVSELPGAPKRGAYLARLAGCITCHTAPGASALSGGEALVLNFGSFFAPNITSDRQAGIGDWTLQKFAPGGEARRSRPRAIPTTLPSPMNSMRP